MSLLADDNTPLKASLPDNQIGQNIRNGFDNGKELVIGVLLVKNHVHILSVKEE
jgi:hypothetical protein